jgi:hypothetical protein
VLELPKLFQAFGLYVLFLVTKVNLLKAQGMQPEYTRCIQKRKTICIFALDSMYLGEAFIVMDLLPV